MSRIKELEDIRENFQEYFELVPEPGEKFRNHYMSTYEGDNTFDAKTKRLIALCGGIIAGCKGCILGQADHAIQEGATVDEILGVCSIAMSLGGTLAGSQVTILIGLLKEKGLIS